ncbi:chromate transporter-domain-containing protein [Lipomyces japonicus]|uniref:chromate transporter-domain-containing protein n=1 Tax=Lipomyces japonicus TaxID=56871 RepID=UPI0034CD4C9F
MAINYFRFLKESLFIQISEVTKYQWYMGITSFGGPVVQFQNFNWLFVEKYNWLNESTYQELFAVAQALPGSASTKLLFIITLLHTSLIPALISFLYWALPGAIGMFSLALVVSNMSDTLPAPVYALLSGLNAATVGVIFLAAAQLSNKTITDKLSLALIFLGGAAGVVYTALWYFPVLMVAGGIIAIVHDLRVMQKIWYSLQQGFHAILKKNIKPEPIAEDNMEMNNLDDDSVWLPEILRDQESSRPEPVTSASRRIAGRTSSIGTSLRPVIADDLSISVSAAVDSNEGIDASNIRAAPVSAIDDDNPEQNYPVFLGIAILIFFTLTFVLIIVIRAVVHSLPITFLLFSNLYLAGTIIFGGGPVVIPLLRQYIVAEGWVSQRDFIIGLAIIQTFPGPNFNFAVYLGTLTYMNHGSSSILGCIVSFVAIYTPGMLVAGGMFTFWNKLRKYIVVTSILRGINSAAIGLVWTAIYRIWESGYLSDKWQGGASLGQDSWWIVVASTAFVGGRGWKIPEPILIFIGGLMGIIRWAITGA